MKCRLYHFRFQLLSNIPRYVKRHDGAEWPIWRINLLDEEEYREGESRRSGAYFGRNFILIVIWFCCRWQKGVDTPSSSGHWPNQKYKNNVVGDHRRYCRWFVSDSAGLPKLSSKTNSCSNDISWLSDSDHLEKSGMLEITRMLRVFSLISLNMARIELSSGK